MVRRARDPAERRPDLRIASAITLIERGRYWYRGQAPEALAATHTYEQVAELLWGSGSPMDPPVWPVDAHAVQQARRAVDFALATLARALGLTPGAGEALFAIGRLAGWLAHAIEEYREPTELRQRAVYTGPRPPTIPNS